MTYDWLHALPTAASPPEPESAPARRDLEALERYLAVLEANRRAGRTAVTDAVLALDMAGFVRQSLREPGRRPCGVSPAVLAMTLVRRTVDAPEQ
ncbi:hypothetical protein [Desulfovibrio legallii]|uniref:Uncharacterized protein n=1 Tax=Desulfovibrio legallii TaxID=571438 RepID=A0A1G7PDI0_9BACT|nr:hypothetical protein [Desulfovibrio legallii]SDF84197.1 hypothetical protein SAMN05192586_11541 [Desulfovibrio legallii]